ncbi:hypothetical protein chiPu_0027227 [Chiloscyllium punctatum]|uniref:Uncharacterized protein n=1 Tax=Chiloscyllium punctatum TaxID=137246 RepID=A0A401TK88_CHIPU|nr:hypothetical protein [Chiloscyllium punctatum]
MRGGLLPSHHHHHPHPPIFPDAVLGGRARAVTTKASVGAGASRAAVESARKKEGKGASTSSCRRRGRAERFRRGPAFLRVGRIPGLFIAFGLVWVFLKSAVVGVVNRSFCFDLIRCLTGLGLRPQASDGGGGGGGGGGGAVETGPLAGRGHARLLPDAVPAPDVRAGRLAAQPGRRRGALLPAGRGLPAAAGAAGRGGGGDGDRAGPGRPRTPRPGPGPGPGLGRARPRRGRGRRPAAVRAGAARPVRRDQLPAPAAAPQGHQPPRPAALRGL